MDASILKSVVSQIQKQYPEFASSQPKVRLQNAPQAKSAGAGPTYLLTFQSTASVKAGYEKKAVPRLMRVVVNEKGKILKVTTSR
jgi:hypothetical protein